MGDPARHRVRVAPLRPIALRKKRAPPRSFGRHRRRHGQTFLFRNPSPVNRGSQDSFVRAIALAEGRTWEEAYQDICRQALSQCDNPQSTSVAASYLSRYAVGTCQYFTRGKTPVKEFLASHPSGAWVLQLGKGWASAVVDGVLMDTRNYINKPIEVAWRLR